MKKRMVWYGRCSNERQEASLDDQWAWSLAKATGENFEIVAGRAFFDDGIPGEQIRRRKGLLALFEFIEREQDAGRPLDGIVLWDRDRLSRADSIKTNVIIDRLREAGLCWCYSMKKGWEDLHDITATTINNLEQDFGRAGYVKSLSGNVSRKLAEIAKAGYWPAGRHPYGFVTVGPKYQRKLVLDERDDGVRWRTVAWIFEQYLTRDTSYTELAKELDRRGVPPPKQGWARMADAERWTSENVRVILHNETYTGDLLYPRRVSGKYHTIRCGEVVPHRPQETASGEVRKLRATAEVQTVYPGAFPQIVSREQFDAVQAKCQANAPAFKKGKTRRTFAIFSKLLTCGQCGQVMWSVGHGWSRHRTGRHYVCSSYYRHGNKECNHHAVSERDLLRILGTAIRDYFSRPEVIDEVRQTIRMKARAEKMDGPDALAALKKRAADLAAEIAQGTTRLARIPDDLLDGLVAELRKLKGQLGETNATIAAAEAQQRTCRQLGDFAEEGLARLQHLPEMLDQAPAALVREVLRLTANHITLHFASAREAQTFRTQDGKEVVVHDTESVGKWRLSHGEIETTSIAQMLGLPATQRFSNEGQSLDSPSLLKAFTIAFRAA